MAHPARPFRPPHSPGAGSPEPTEPTKPTAQAKAPQGSGHSGPGVPGRMADAETAAAPASDARAGGRLGGRRHRLPSAPRPGAPYKGPAGCGRGGAGPGRGARQCRARCVQGLGLATRRAAGGGRGSALGAREFGKVSLWPAREGQSGRGCEFQGSPCVWGGGVFSRRAVAELTGDPRGLCGSVYHVVACKWSLVRPNCDLGP